MLKTYDAIIIGTGAGGAVVGKQLAQSGKSVLFLECGSAVSKEDHRDSGSQAVKRMYANQGFTWAIGNSLMALPYGRVVGGTTTINSGTCFRAPQSIHHDWVQKHQLKTLSYENFLPHYEAVEHELGIAPCAFETMSESNKIMARIASKENIHGSRLVRNAIDCDGCGMCCYGCTLGKKQSMDVSYIPKALRMGAEIKTETEAVGLVYEGKQVTGVRVRSLKTKEEFVIKSSLVIVSAGSYSTPVFLKKSKIRSPKHLGKHLTVHPATKVYAEFDEDLQSWNGIPQAYSLDALHDQGILFEGVFMPPEIAASMNQFVGKELRDFMHGYSRIFSYGFLIEDSTSGSVRNLPLLGTSLFYNLTSYDVTRIQMAIAFLARLLLRNGAKRVIPMIKSSLKELRTQEEIDQFENMKFKPQQVETAAFHPLGTARMASSLSEGVVDENAKVFGFDGLYVSDGSIVPSSLGVNPQMTIMAFSHRLASHLLNG